MPVRNVARRGFFLAGAATVGSALLLRPRRAEASVNTGVCLQPLGNGQDDWPTLLQYAQACAYSCPIILMPGSKGEPWLCQSTGQLPNGTVINGTPGTKIIQSLPSGTGDPRVAAFESHYTPYPNVESALTAPVTLGSTTISVLGKPFVVGNYILIDQLSSGSMRNAVYKVIAVSGSGPSTLTLDRPVLYPFAENDPITLIDPVRDIVINGNGMTMTGTGARYIELIGAVNCHVSDIKFDPSSGSVDERFISFDVPSFDSHMERLTGDGGGTTTLGVSFECGDSCSASECHVTNCSIGGYVFQDSVQCSLVDCHGYANAGAGVFVISSATNFEGSSDCLIFGGSFTNNGVGISIESGSSKTRIVGASISNNARNGVSFTVGPYHLANTSISQCTFSHNGASAVALPSTVVQTSISDCTFEKNAVAVTIAPGASGTIVRGCVLTDNGMNIASDCDISNVTATMSSTGSTVLLMQAGSAITGRNVTITSAASGNVVLAVGDAMASLSQVAISIAALSNGIVTAGNGAVITLADTQVSPTASFVGTVGIFAAAGTIRMRECVDASACQTPSYSQNGGYLSLGHVVAAGTSTVAVAWPDLQNTDYVVLTRTLSVGAPVDMPTVQKTSGTGFSITADPNDASTYEYWIGGLPAKSA